MFGSLMLTTKKIVFGAVISVVAYLLLILAGVSQAWTIISIVSLWIGIIFPDLDMVVGFAKGLLQAASSLVFLFGAIILFLYPYSMPLAGNFCSDANMNKMFGMGGLALFCNIGVSLIFLAVCYLITHFVIGLMPQTGSFHNFFMGLLIVVVLALLSRMVLSDIYSWLALVSFGVGYAMHLLVDGEKKNR